MPDITWERFSVNEYFCIWGRYTLKRKNAGMVYIYEVWQDDTKLFITPRQSELLQKLAKEYKKDS